MVDMSLIGGLSNSLNVALNITKALIGIRDQGLIGEKVAELTRVLLEAYEAQMALNARVSELEAELVSLKNWDAEKQRYELITPDTGAFTYTKKAGMEAAEPPHWLCANCYVRGQKSFLQSAGAAPHVPGDPLIHLWRCPACAGTVRVGHRVTPASFAEQRHTGKPNQDVGQGHAPRQ